MDDSNWIDNPQNPHWNVEDINFMIDELEKGNLFGAYGIKTSNEMTGILQKYMIDNVRFIFIYLKLMFYP